MDVVYLSFQERSPDIYNKVMLARDGDQKAIAFLLERYKKSLLSTILKIVRNLDDAEDITIETFEKAFRNLHRFDPKYSFSTWLFKIGSNRSIDFLRHNRLKTTSIHQSFTYTDGDEFSIEIPSGDADPQEILQEKQRRENLHQIVAQVPAIYQTLIRLKYFEELSLEEIQLHLDIPMNTIKIRLYRARNLLTGILEGKQNKPD